MTFTPIYLCVAYWICAAYIAAGLAFDFDCRRNGVDCGQGNDCDVSNGRCVCTTSPQNNVTYNYRCQSATEFPCSESFYGDGCQLERVQADCTGESMFVNINPEGNFDGLVYVFGKEGIPDCQLQPTVDPPDFVKDRDLLTGLSLVLKYQDVTCGDALEVENNDNGTKTITNTRDYFVQYNKNFRSNLDQKVKVKCVLTEGKAKVASKVEDVQEGNGGFKDVSVDSDADLDVITFVIRDKADNPLSSDVNLGDEIKLVFTLKRGRGYVDFSLASCIANNTVDQGEDNADFRSVVIVENDCPSDEAQALFHDGVVKGDDSHSMVVSISAFMFSGGKSTVGFSCDVTLCREDDRENCQKQDCAGITSDADKIATPEVDRNTTQPSGNSSSSDTSSPTNGTNGNTTSSTDDTSMNNGTDTGISTNTTGPQNNDTATIDNNTPIENNTGGDTNNTAPGDNNTAQTNNTSNDNATVNETNNNNNNETTQAAEGGDAGDVRRRRSVEEEGTFTQRVYRRSTDGEGTPTQRVYSGMTVNDPTAIIEESPTEHVTKDCLQEPEVITLVAILSVIVLTLTLVTLVVVCHVIRHGVRRTKTVDEEEDDRKVKDTELVSRVVDSTPSRSFNIPRLEIRGTRPMPYTNT